MFHIAEFHHPHQLQPLQSVWNRLYDRTPNASVSQSFDWIISQHRPAESKLRVLLGILGGRPFGILPLKVEERTTPQGTLRVLSGAGEPSHPFAGPVGSDTTAMLMAGLRHLQRSRRDWDRIEFCTAGDFEPFDRRLKNAFRILRWNCEITPAEEKGTNATRPGFRYTHNSRWALRARWMQFRERLGIRRKVTPHVPETNSSPGPHRLSLYAPTSFETPSTPRSAP